MGFRPRGPRVRERCPRGSSVAVGASLGGTPARCAPPRGIPPSRVGGGDVIVSVEVGLGGEVRALGGVTVAYLGGARCSWRESISAETSSRRRLAFASRALEFENADFQAPLVTNRSVTSRSTGDGVPAQEAAESSLLVRRTRRRMEQARSSSGIPCGPCCYSARASCSQPSQRGSVALSLQALRFRPTFMLL